MSKVDALRAELALAEAEAELVAAKANPDATYDEIRTIKHKVRALRAAQRADRAETS